MNKIVDIFIIFCAACLAVCFADVPLKQCYQYADTQIVGMFHLNGTKPVINDNVTSLHMLYDSLGIHDCDAQMSLTMPSTMCESSCPWISRCNTSQFSAFSSKVPVGSRLAFTGAARILGQLTDLPFTCQSDVIKQGFNEYILIIYLPCNPGQNAKDYWNVTNMSCTLKVVPSEYPSAEYSEFRQNITLVSFNSASVYTISMFVLLISMLLSLLA